MPAGPCDGQQKRALFKGLHVMRDALIQCKQTAGEEIERPALGPHLDVADNGLDGDPTLRLMPTRALAL